MKKTNLIFLSIICSVFICAFIVTSLSTKNVSKNSYKDEQLSTNELEEFVAANSNDITAKKNLAFKYLAQQEDLKAIDLLKNVLDIDKSDAESLHQLVIAYIRTGQFELAKQTSERLLEFNNHNGVALFNLAQINFLLEDYSSFNENVDKAIQSSSINNLEGFEKTFFEDVNTVIEEHRKLLEQGKKYEGYKLLAQTDFFEAKFKLRNYELAVANTKKAEQSVLEKKGKLELESQQLDLSKKTFNELTTLYPEYEYGYLLLADTLLKLNDTEGLNLLKEKTVHFKQASQFIKSISLFEKNKAEGISQLEKMINSIDESYDSLYLYNLIYMKNKLDQNENTENLIEKFWSSKGDLDYIIAIQNNKKLQENLNS